MSHKCFCFSSGMNVAHYCKSLNAADFAIVDNSVEKRMLTNDLSIIIYVHKR
jgi:hypothetical protein